MSPQSEKLNEFVSQQVNNCLSPLKNNLEFALEQIKQSNSPYLSSSLIEMLNNLSKDTVQAINFLILNANLGSINENYIILYKFFSFNSSNGCAANNPIYDRPCTNVNLKKINYQLLYLENFIIIEEKNEHGKLIPRVYNNKDNSIDVYENLTIIIEIIQRVLNAYENKC